MTRILTATLTAIIATLLVIIAAELAQPRATPSPQPVVTSVQSATVAREWMLASVPAPLAFHGSVAAPIIGGRATWYPASGMIAAAGPALRHYLGPHWRGTLVSVASGGRVVVVRVSDWCDCRGRGSERLIDLSDDAFAQLAPLSRGVIRVSIMRTVRVPEPPATDRD